ncbi:MAG: hypothetical protein BGO25_16800 [Acidobacteriales bacterium 59-55]|nr:MAG: hypothetical protein BGO25_16800 [Acidobacteriales bacterium 59-55]
MINQDNESEFHPQATEWSRREFLRISGQLGLASAILPAGASAMAIPAHRTAATDGAYEYAAGEVTLPFSYSIARSSAPRPEGLDFSHQLNPDNCQVFVRMGNELWEFRSQWIINLGTVARFKGPDIDHMTRVEDGTYPDGMTACWFLGGMWYDESEQKLYAPMHVEQDGIRRTFPGSRKIALGTSTDQGKTWHYEGDIITSENYYYAPDFFKFSGSGYGIGVADFGFYVDKRDGYFYVFPDDAWTSRESNIRRWNSRAARCSITDKMAPGKWKYFYNGTWDEPALGGKSSTVAPSHLWGITYSTPLNRYICMFLANQDPPTHDNIDGIFIGSCTDLGKQDWVWGYCPEAPFGFMNLINSDGTGVADVSSDSFRFYSYFANNSFDRMDIKLSPGKTTTMNLQPRYMFEPHPESSDPMLGRVTKIVGSQSPEMKYTGSWIDQANPASYEGQSSQSATRNSSVEFSFQGDAVYWRALCSPHSGKAEIYLDGALRKTVDCYSPQSTSYEQFVYIRTGLSPTAKHTIKIVVTGQKNPKATAATVNHIAFEYSAESYKASAGFSGLMGKNNWHYQQWNGTEYSDLTFLTDEAHPRLYWSGSGDCAVGGNYLVPGNSHAVRKWIAPHGGTVRIEGVVVADPQSDNNFVAGISVNGETIWPDKPLIAGQKLSHDLRRTVIQGDAVIFMAGKKGLAASTAPANSGKVTWDPVITFTESVPPVWQPNQPGNRNLALHKYARSKVLVSHYRPFDAVDGNLNTAFTMPADDVFSSGDDWLQLDLENSYMLDRYVFVAQTADSAYRPSSFKLLKSDNGFAWTEVDSVTNAEFALEHYYAIPLVRITRDVPAFRARYVRLYLPKGKPFTISAFELYYAQGKSSFSIPIPSGA